MKNFNQYMEAVQDIRLKGLEDVIVKFKPSINVYGNGGIGKIHAIEKVLKENNISFKTIDGRITPNQFKIILDEIPKNHVVIIDDIDVESLDNKAILNYLKDYVLSRKVIIVTPKKIEEKGLSARIINFKFTEGNE